MIEIKIKIIALFCLVILLLTGCDFTKNKTYFSNEFYYKILDEENIAIGNLNSSYSKNYVFVPAYIEAYKVSQIGFSTGLGFGGNGYLTSIFNNGTILERFYIPNTIETIDDRYMYMVNNEFKVFYSGKVIDLGKLTLNKESKIYVLNEMFNDFFNVIGNNYKNNLYRANVAYHLNYEIDNPYYYIDYYDYGSKLLFIPPNPSRNGFIFDGWYKDSECSTKWDFENDIIPYLNENEQFKEIKLYAKWQLG